MTQGIKIVLIFLGIIAGLTALALVVTYLTFPRSEAPPDLRVEATPERVERGRYLVEHVAACLDCHSQRDWSQFGGPVVPGTEGRGGEVLKGEFGALVAPNITPAAIGGWTDGELYRAITGGISPNGDAYFPVMPYHQYGLLADEDVHAIIAYLRTLKPIEHRPEAKRSLAFPLNILVRFMPRPGSPGRRPDPADEVSWGRYLATAAACSDCHTPKERGHAIPGLTMAGGNQFPLPDGRVVRSPNITPDPKTGIGGWTREQFVQRFKAFAEPAPATTAQTVMPWRVYAGMSERDLGALHAYLRSLQAVERAD